MTDNSTNSGPLVDFILSQLDPCDQEVADRILPLPDNVVPSEPFINQTRIRLVAFMRTTVTSRAA